MFDTDELVEDPIAGVEDAIARLADADRSGWSAAARSEAVLGLVRTAERLQAEVLRAVGEWDAISAWAEDGGLSPVAWLTARAPVTKGGAARLVRSARLVRTHEPTAAASARGEVSVAHVEVMADAISRREDVFAEHGEILLDAATRVPPEQFRIAARRWRCLADDVAATGDAFAVHERRFLSLASTFRGAGVGHFELEPDAYATVLSAVDSYAAPDPAGDPSRRRTLAQRRADVLVEICSESLARQERTDAPSPTPTLSWTCSR